MLENVTSREKPADSSNIKMQNIKFRLLLTENHYTYPKSFHLCFPIEIKKISKCQQRH